MLAPYVNRLVEEGMRLTVDIQRRILHLAGEVPLTLSLGLLTYLNGV